MSGKFHRNINERILYKLVGLFQILNHTLYNWELCEDEKLSKIKSEFVDCQKQIGEDIGSYVSNNIFCLQAFKEKKVPKQYIHVKSLSFRKPFEICLN
jgi:hypothetical protein